MCKETRQCRICQEVKPLDQFEIDRRYKAGHYTTRCRSCKYESGSVANRAWHHLKERAAKEGRKLEISQEEIEKLFLTFETCIYCGVHQNDVDEVFQVDHLIARSLGGTDVLANLICSCARCNRMKGAKTVAQFFFENRELISDANFTLLAHYVAITSGQPVESVIFDMANQYALYLFRKEREVATK
ncbi:HNH endonuclease [Neobacillus drentensis]|uniref:HNH endonuclease n=1 Tax=Neobacillus drentensis TaxID=220684 RepID=UPI002FFDC7D2